MTDTFRQRILDRLDRIGCRRYCGYIDSDTVSAVCPLCAGVLAVTFTDIAVRFRCCDAGCDEDQIARVVFDRDRETDEMVDAHRDRLIALLVKQGTSEATIQAVAARLEDEAEAA